MGMRKIFGESKNISGPLPGKDVKNIKSLSGIEIYPKTIIETSALSLCIPWFIRKSNYILSMNHETWFDITKLALTIRGFDDFEEELRRILIRQYI
jgi:hypothetical protein